MILDEILAQTRRAVAEARQRRPFATIAREAAAASPPRGFAAALRKPGQSGSAARISCIAEIKRRSPSAGWIWQEADAAAVARTYEEGGAAALSVLTDAPFFGGSLDDLIAARAAVRLPVLRKDFIIDPYQVVEARAAGADAILLIVAALTDTQLTTLLGEADRMQLDTLVETHDATEIDRALAVGARVIGINHRDLTTFEMDMGLATRLRPRIPPAYPVVAESGIRTAEDVRRMSRAGVDAILVGENLMKARDPATALRALLDGS
jgi:indole-3-glycerol phosphate synthase